MRLERLGTRSSPFTQRKNVRSGFISSKVRHQRASYRLARGYDEPESVIAFKEGYGFQD